MDSGLRRNDGLLIERFPKINPARIEAFNEFNFPRPLPFLDLLFACNCRQHFIVNFIPDEARQTVSANESRALACAMLLKSLRQIRRNACVQGAIAPIGQHVNARLLHRQCIPCNHTETRAPCADGSTKVAGAARR